MKYAVTITREYAVESSSEDDAVIEALRLEETEACEWPNSITVTDWHKPNHFPDTITVTTSNPHDEHKP